MPRLFPFLSVIALVLTDSVGGGNLTPLVAQEPQTAAASPADPAGVEFFEKNVRPLLAARCHECHGPQKQKANLRLDSRPAVLKGGDTGPAVVPGKPEESLLVDAIRYGQSYQMPPKSQLPVDEIATLIEWVRLGAPWGADSAPTTAAVSGTFDLQARAKHWCFQRLAAVDPPEVQDASWIKTPVDRFILAGLEAAGMKPAPPCDKATLLRRVTYDLIGLPPTPAEINDFLADASPAAYEEVVDRLLASPHYGERWARHWLDLVRYAETHGHEHDFEMANPYRYRDYVIRALNADLPYDQFVIEHVAGDLLSVPRRDPREGTNESIIATGFFFLGEAKHSPVDVRQDDGERIDNQIDVFAKTFLALTVSCARCHDHKFDPISTKDYYALAGYLQSSRYQQAFIDPVEPLTERIAKLQVIKRQRERASVELTREVLASQIERLADTMLTVRDGGDADPWTKYVREVALVRAGDPFHPWAVLTSDPLPAARDAFATRRAELAARLAMPSTQESTKPPTIFADFSDASYGSWQTTGAAFGDAPARPLAWDFGRPRGRFPGQLVEATAAHSGLVSLKLRGVIRSPTFEIVSPKIFYRLYGTGGQLRLIVDGLQLIQNPIYGGLKFAPEGPQPKWHAQDVSKWVGHRAYIEVIDDGDGFIALEKVAFGERPPDEQGANRLIVDMLADDSTTSPTALVQKYEALLRELLAAWPDRADDAPERVGDRASVINWVLDQRVPGGESLGPKVDEFTRHLAELDARQRDLEGGIAPPRQAMALADGTVENERVFIRGSHKTLGEEVPRRFLEVLGGTRCPPPAEGSGRLEMARQLVSADNPLVPRVMVNRIWQHHFGEGLVRTTDDFGVMGRKPTHPELLDWLAAQFIRQGWSIKQMHRLLVLSNTYQMSSQTQAEADMADPENQHLHRMTMRRLEAECIRDAMLAVSGRIDLTLSGPSVMPYLTPYMTGRGRPATSGPLDGQGRRSIYLAVRRNFLPPMFLAFDYPIPFTTIGRRGVSNVPAQALAMMNNELVVELARLWGERVCAGPDRPSADRVREMYLTALGRQPDDSEMRQAIEFVGSSTAGAQTQTRPWADLAHVIFNLKEFIFIP